MTMNIPIKKEVFKKNQNETTTPGEVQSDKQEGSAGGSDDSSPVPSGNP